MTIYYGAVHLSHVRLASGTVKKVIEINSCLLGTMAGGAGMSLSDRSCYIEADTNQLIVNTGRRTLVFNADCTNYATESVSLSLQQANTSATWFTATRAWVSVWYGILPFI